MRHDLSQETIAQATRCQRQLACLDEGEHIYCKVESYIRDGVVFVRCLHENYCAYQMDFGGGRLCSCPVRSALWKQYHV